VDFTGTGENQKGGIRCDALGDLFFARYRLPGAVGRDARRSLET